jgi:hypothetical protein
MRWATYDRPFERYLTYDAMLGGALIQHLSNVQLGGQPLALSAPSSRGVDRQ